MNNSLYIVATPIGNLADITLRAIDVLKGVHIIAAEDTRHSAKLLQHYHISTPLIPYHDHGDENQTKRLLEKLQKGESIALISDAGTPLISDPGFKLVREVRAAGIRVEPIPGPSALIAALSAAGLPTDKFSFEGFPPAKELARQALFQKLSSCQHTLVFYESPHRVKDCLQDMCAVFGENRQAVLARELSKNFETFLADNLAGLLQKVQDDPNQSRGEIVLLIHGQEKKPEGEELGEEALRVLNILLDELSVKQASALAAKITGEKKNKLYKVALGKP